VINFVSTPRVLVTDGARDLDAATSEGFARVVASDPGLFPLSVARTITSGLSGVRIFGAGSARANIAGACTVFETYPEYGWFVDKGGNPSYTLNTPQGGRMLSGMAHTP
jgi:hypothetical protein